MVRPGGPNQYDQDLVTVAVPESQRRWMLPVIVRLDRPECRSFGAHLLAAEADSQSDSQGATTLVNEWTSVEHNRCKHPESLENGRRRTTKIDLEDCDSSRSP